MAAMLCDSFVIVAVVCKHPRTMPLAMITKSTHRRYANKAAFILLFVFKIASLTSLLKQKL